MLFGLFRRRRSIHVEIASFCECGPVRRENQDHVLVNRRGLVFCVADGMGGGEAGGQASDIICRSIDSALREHVGFADRVRLVDDAIRRADDEIRAIASSAGYRQMGSTVAVLISDGKRIAAVGNVGDSRVYRLRDRKLQQLTRDHTLTEAILASRPPQGVRPLADVRALALSHVLTRAVGVGQDRLKVDWRKFDVKDGDVLLVCSDGVHGAMPPSALSAAVSGGGDAKAILSRICALVVAAGAHDNYSAVVVKIGGAG
jgi:protein phosphatase